MTKTIENYSVCLNKKVVEECKLQYKQFGGKLSPLINKLLENWLKTQDKKKKKVNPREEIEIKDKKSKIHPGLGDLGDDIDLGDNI